MTKNVNAEVAAKIATAKEMKQKRVNFKKEAREAARAEWMKLNEDFESVYVFRAPDNISETNALIFNDLDPDEYASRTVTVVGLVKKENDGSFTLQIGWSQCSAFDNFDRKVGNLIAGRRAANPDEPFQSTNGLMTKPMVLRGFNSKFLKENFISIAALLIDEYQDSVNIYTGEPLERTTGQIFTYKQGNEIEWDEQDDAIDLVEGEDYEDVTEVTETTY